MQDFFKKHKFALSEKLEKYLYIILMTSAFLTYGSRYQAPMIIPQSIAVIIFLYALYKYIQSKKKDGFSKLIRKIFLLYFVPVLVIHVYSIVMMMLGVMDKNYLSTNLSAYAPVIAAIASLYLFKQNSIKYNLYAILISWSINFIICSITNGVGVIPYAISQGYFNNTNPILGVKTNYLELHDMVLALGLYVIYFIFSKKTSKKDLLILSAVLVIIALGIKRIAIPGIIIATILTVLTRKKSEQRILQYSIAISVIIFIASFSFLYLIFTNKLTDLTGGINLMGRNYYYDTIKNYGTFSPLFLGLGRNSVSMILLSKHAYLHVGGVHSDILKMYIENGFIMFTIWLCYYLFTVPQQLKKYLNTKTMLLYSILMIYTFILYLTDNVENYYIYQILLIIIPCCYYLESNPRKLIRKTRKRNGTKNEK